MRLLSYRGISFEKSSGYFLTTRRNDAVLSIASDDVGTSDTIVTSKTLTVSDSSYWRTLFQIFEISYRITNQLAHENGQRQFF